MYKFVETKPKSLADMAIVHYVVEDLMGDGFKDMVLVNIKDFNSFVAQLKETHGDSLKSVFCVDAYKVREVRK